MQGVYNKVKTRKLIAESGVNNPVNAVPKVSIEVPVRTPKVLTTASFAEKPVMSAVGIRQSSKPSGAKMGASQCPIMASRLSALSATTFRRLSKLCRNQINTVATKIIVNALCRKSFALSHMRRNTLFAEGKR